MVGEQFDVSEDELASVRLEDVTTRSVEQLEAL